MPCDSGQSCQNSLQMQQQRFQIIPIFNFISQSVITSLYAPLPINESLAAPT